MKFLVALLLSWYNPQGNTNKLISYKNEGFCMSKLIQKYKHAWVLLYIFIYFPCFIYLEKHVTTDFHVIYTPLDDKIPFIEYFIVPYMLWFAYIAVTVMYFFFTNVKDFYRLTAFLVAGMTLFLIISAVYPNGLELRPEVFARDNIFVDMVKQLYRTDTPTNVLPSIHVFNSIGAAIAIMRSQRLKSKKYIQYGSLILSLSIILSTMFLKQHSVIDVIAAGIIATVCYSFIYAGAPKKQPKFSHQPI